FSSAAVFESAAAEGFSGSTIASTSMDKSRAGSDCCATASLRFKFGFYQIVWNVDAAIAACRCISLVPCTVWLMTQVGELNSGISAIHLPYLLQELLHLAVRTDRRYLHFGFKDAILQNSVEIPCTLSDGAAAKALK